MTVLVTRPSPFGEALVQQLNKHDIKAWHTPLITFIEGQQLNQFAEKIVTLTAGDLLLFVSQQAVHYANQALATHHLDWPVDLRYFAIGRATANSLHQVTNCQIHYPKDREISEHLLQLPELQNIHGKNALVLRGNGGRGLLAEQLQLRGANVEFFECYQRKLIAYSSVDLIAVWQQQGVDTLVLTSAEMLERIYRLVAEKDRPWLFNCQLIVVSERIAHLAHQLGWDQIKIADNADNHSLLAALK